MIKILFIKVNPIGTTNLFLDEEENTIENALNTSAHRDRYDFESKGAVTISELHTYLENFKPNVLHISGHGNDEGILYFHDDENHKKEVSLNKFIEVIKNYKPHLKCVFLNACFSLMDTNNIPVADDLAVIGMKKEIPNDTAMLFSQSFYTSFFGGKCIHDAFNSAIGVVGIDGFGEEHIPVILGKTDLKYTEAAQDAIANNEDVIADNIIPTENFNIARTKEKKRKRQYLFLIGVISIISAVFVGISLYQELGLSTLFGFTPLASLKWIKDKLDNIENSLTLLEMLENEIKEFIERLKIPPPVANANETKTVLREKFWDIVT